MINFIRAWLFNIFFYGGSLILSILFLPALLLPQKILHKIIQHGYFGYVAFIEKYVLGLKLEIRGWENLPKEGAYILASKHQSAYETLKLPLLIDDIAIVLKRELTWLPLWGWYPARMGMIAIDRGAGTTAMRSIIRGAERIKKEGRPILIFPQGTRVAPGAQESYKVGLTKIYKETQLPVVPMALNAGIFWPRNGFIKKPGTVIFEFFPALPGDMDPHALTKKVEDILEPNSTRLEKEAKSM